jgi:hypothetical protein
LPDGWAAAFACRRISGDQLLNTSSPHWRGWLKAANRCHVPFNSFAEYAPEPNPVTKKRTWSGLLSMTIGP